MSDDAQAIAFFLTICLFAFLSNYRFNVKQLRRVLK